MKRQITCLAYGVVLLICGLRCDITVAKPAAPATQHVVTPTHKASGAASASGGASAKAEATYDCCIKRACTYCKNNSGPAGSAPAGQCRCFAGITSGKAVCAECHGAWEVGQGSVPGKSKKDVRKLKMLKP
ncbi:MAG: hypothetical protein JO316_10185 [Abitibacteriaceae bacterium]|nr:hypothetical protein [Abditibacteriaceae bacterium]MBV9865709.1 hypothetical protein [Abditibacteriaceae bacterium]